MRRRTRHRTEYGIYFSFSDIATDMSTILIHLTETTTIYETSPAPRQLSSGVQAFKYKTS